MLRLNILLALIYVNTCFAQERSFRFGVGPATTFAFVQQPHNTVAAAYSLRFSTVRVSEKGQIKGLCLDLTELSTLRSIPVTINGEKYTEAERTNYGNPAITLAVNLGKEIKRHDSKLYYYGVAGPVLATVGQTGLGAMAGVTGGYAYAVAERMAIAVEVSPSWHYLHMFGPHAVVMANVVFFSVPCTFNVHLMLKKEKKKNSL